MEAKPQFIKIHDLSQDDIGKVSLYRQSATRYLRGRAFIITSRGFLGLGPAYAKENDRVCFLTGAGTPVLLRCHEERCRWIGATYIHGCIDGGLLEYLLGGHGTRRKFTVC